MKKASKTFNIPYSSIYNAVNNSVQSSKKNSGKFIKFNVNFVWFRNLILGLSFL